MGIIKKLFGKDKSKSEESKESYHKKMEGDYIEREAFVYWMEGENELSELVEKLKSEYEKFQSDALQHSQWVDFLKSDGVNGIMIHLNEYPGTISNWLYPAEFFKDIGLSWGYKLYSSEERKRKKEKKGLYFRHYLKPPVRNMLEKPIEQLFGNITVELKLRQSGPQSLKLQVQHYNDRNYKEPRDIQEFYYSIFKFD